MQPPVLISCRPHLRQFQTQTKKGSNNVVATPQAARSLFLIELCKAFTLLVRFPSQSMAVSSTILDPKTCHKLFFAGAGAVGRHSQRPAFRVHARTNAYLFARQPPFAGFCPMLSRLPGVVPRDFCALQAFQHICLISFAHSIQKELRL